MNYNEQSLILHESTKGKIEINSKVPLKTQLDLSLAYTPGVAEPCRRIATNPENVYKYTSKGNMVAIVSDGSAVLGLGNIGASASIPVMEGKAILFKAFANVDAFPICLKTQSVDEIVSIIQNLEPVFGGINLEDIASPRCVEIERKLKETLEIPVFHDDQHGTAIVVCAALINALKIVNKDLKTLKIVINGAGSAGNAIAHMLIELGATNIIMCDINGILEKGDPKNNWVQEEIALITNPNMIVGHLTSAIKSADVFIGVSAKDSLSEEMVRSMANDSIVFAMANPDPEIMPENAFNAGAKIVGTGRSDLPNQINNVLAFPGIFRGALDAHAKDITSEMKIAAVHAISNLVSDSDLREDYIIPSALDQSVSSAVAKAVYIAATKS